jgi:hypothetical protein
MTSKRAAMNGGRAIGAMRTRRHFFDLLRQIEDRFGVEVQYVTPILFSSDFTFTRWAAIVEDEIEGIGIPATEHSAPFYARFGFRRDTEPGLDPVFGCRIRRISMPYTRLLGESAGALLDGVTRVRFDGSCAVDPFADSRES